jgi:phosphatidylserine/phosphatidylglycerophosphate/cardiolipin synthase-like enzyme
VGSILQHRSARWRIHGAARTGVIVDGRDYYAAFYEAASRATRSILLLGWQFDSDVMLLRGEDAPSGADLELLAFLDGLCRARPNLEVRVLAWDHSLVYAFEREVLQKLLFDVSANERLEFRWDATAPWPGSHHQKVAIIDGRIAFLGSQDLCQSRWDDSTHRADNALRTSRFGLRYKPYHEVQAAIAGDAVRSLVDLFVDRWRYATGEELDPARFAPRRGDAAMPPLTIDMPPARVALARTVPEGPGRPEVHEVRSQLVRAIASAEKLVYAESQFVTSSAIRDALVRRMQDKSRPLDVVFVVPHRAGNFKEALTVGLAQRDVLAVLARAAQENGHRLGVYDVEAAEDVFVYVHSKVLVVDDRFLTIGSANLTNRSMTMDSEIHASWEADRRDGALRAAIRRVRARLLLEHLGDAAEARIVAAREGIVTRLDAIADSRRGRLRRHALDVEEPNALARAVGEIACEYVDPMGSAA